MATLKGTWRFNDVLTKASFYNEVYFDFQTVAIINGESYKLYCNTIYQDVNEPYDSASLQYIAVSSIPDLSELGISFPLGSYVYDGSTKEWRTDLYGEGIQTITFTEEQEVSDEFYAWFTANASETDYPDRPTADTIIAKIKSLIARTNEVTGKADRDLTDGINSLAEGYGAGGGESGDLVITNASHLFYAGVRLDVLDALCSIIHNCKDFDQMFYYCSALTTIPELDTSNGTRFYHMFYGCEKLTTIPELDTSNGTTFEGMFYYCSALTTIPELDTSNGTSFHTMFSACPMLTTIPILDIGKGTIFYNTFNNCKALTTLYLYNIRKSIQIGSGTSWGHLLTLDSLVHTIKELCTVTSSQTLTIGSANLEKIANIYCKIVDDTHEKKTMELCESTDEGAMLITDYATEKGWQIK